MLRDLDLSWPHGPCILVLAAPYVSLIDFPRASLCCQTPGRVVLFLDRCSRRVYESLF